MFKKKDMEVVISTQTARHLQGLEDVEKCMICTIWDFVAGLPFKLLYFLS